MLQPIQLKKKKIRIFSFKMFWFGPRRAELQAPPYIMYNTKTYILYTPFMHENFQMRTSTLQNHVSSFCLILQERNYILVCFVATQRRVCCSNFYKMLTFERDGDRKLIFAKCELNLNMFTSCTNIVSHSLFIICAIHVQIKSPKFRKVTSIVSLYDQSSNVTSHVNSERWAIYDF